jgi:hypothetical protein
MGYSQNYVVFAFTINLLQIRAVVLKIAISALLVLSLNAEFSIGRGHYFTRHLLDFETTTVKMLF